MHKIKVEGQIYKVLKDNGHLLWCNAHSVLVDFNGRPTEARMIGGKWEFVEKRNPSGALLREA
jgi:hypothetical protein